MALPSVYTQVYGQIPEFFSKIQEGQAPSNFTQQHLKDIGFASTNHRAFIQTRVRRYRFIGFRRMDTLAAAIRSPMEHLFGGSPVVNRKTANTN